VLFAIVLVVIVFGWTGGKQLVSSSYAGAKEQVAERREESRRKRAEKKADKAEQADRE
jgi:hypothetical protein